MFQTFKRARFLIQNNQPDPRTRDLATMHVWLRKHRWPADDFVDLFMRANPDFDQTRDGEDFRRFVDDQFAWVHGRDRAALARICERIGAPRYRKVDREKLFDSISAMLGREPETGGR